jgi:iron complex outermembrane recepter protein
MRNALLWTLLFLFSCMAANAQNPSSGKDSSLEEVFVRAFEQNKQLKTVAAAVSLISRSQLDRYGNMSLLPAINTTPGARMEERSPGSYRLNIRGSTLRSPFGVRNVKVYWNEIPFTDPGGNTYLNQLSFFNIQSVEIIKGPAGSIYGAGTGGALLLSSRPALWQPGVSLDYNGASYATQSFHAGISAGGESNRNHFDFTHQSGNGYRDHTQMRRDIGTWENSLKISEKQQLNTYFLYGDLYYQTPGALNLKEFSANPRAARPAAGGLPSADQSQAAIYQKMLLAGISNQYQFSGAWKNTTTVYGSFVQFRNPTFRAYEIRSEPQFGGRTVFSYDKRWTDAALSWTSGAEVQKSFFNTRDFSNKGGVPDTLQTDDDIDNWTYTLFSQANLSLQGKWDITLGASLNRSHIGDQRLSNPGLPLQERTYSNQLAPRLALSRKISRNTWAYASIAKGFSPPAVAEVLPPSRTISTSLDPEKGVNYELGIKGSAWDNRLYYEVNAFYFRLEDAIVQRTALNAANFYTNAGHTKQKGIESQLAYQFLPHAIPVFRQLRVWVSHTWNDFLYDDFKQGNNDYSGKKMPSVAPNTLAAGLDAVTRGGLFAHITYYYSDPIYLNDANTDRAGSYNLLGGQLGYQGQGTHAGWKLYAGVDNLFNATYSLGNDINAAAGRYYNAAPGINYYMGLSLQLK